MALKRYKPTTPGRRHAELPDYSELSQVAPEKSLLRPKPKKAGRNSQGHITARWRGGGHKRQYRVIDFTRDKDGIPARVMTQEYDPNRSAWITLLNYADGEKRYIIAPVELRVGAIVEAGENAEVSVGNSLPLAKIPLGSTIHNLEFYPKSGGAIARSAGTSAKLIGKEADQAHVRLPSGEVRLFRLDCRATVGEVSNPDHKNVKHGSAGRMRHLGWKPEVRGTAMNPVDHPHGGGEGRGHVGGPKVSPTGKTAKGGRTRNPRKKSKALIVRHAGEGRR